MMLGLDFSTMLPGAGGLSAFHTETSSEQPSLSARSWAQSLSLPPLPTVRTKRRTLLSLPVWVGVSPGRLALPSAHGSPSQSPACVCRELTDPTLGFPLHDALSMSLKSGVPEQRSCRGRQPASHQGGFSLRLSCGLLGGKESGACQQGRWLLSKFPGRGNGRGYLLILTL